MPLNIFRIPFIVLICVTLQSSSERLSCELIEFMTMITVQRSFLNIVSCEIFSLHEIVELNSSPNLKIIQYHISSSPILNAKEKCMQHASRYNTAITVAQTRLGRGKLERGSLGAIVMHNSTGF